MRISKLMMPALTLAGALALAGCGGGSDTPAAPPANNEEGGMKPPPEPAPKTAEVPDDRTVGGGFAGLKVTLAAGETKNVNGLWYTCEGGTCSVEVPAGTSVSAVGYTGTGTLTIRTADHRAADSTTGTTAQPTESTDPLSNDVLLKALKANADRVAADKTVWNAGTGGGTVIGVNGTSGINGTPPTFTPIGGPTTTLWINGGTGAYWGIWKESTRPTGATQDVNGERGVVWGGTTRYGKKPESTLTPGTATYGGTDGGVLLYHSADGKDWSEGTGTLNLAANFGTGKIGGTIDASSLDTVGRVNGAAAVASVNDIQLMETDIGSAGTFSGTAAFSHSSIARDSGSWNGAFFGQTTAVNDDGQQMHAPPANVAGQFTVSRPQIDGITPGAANARQSQLHVRGAFGN